MFYDRLIKCFSFKDKLVKKEKNQQQRDQVDGELGQGKIVSPYKGENTSKD